MAKKKATLSRLAERPTRTAKFTRPLDPNDASTIASARQRVTRTASALDNARDQFADGAIDKTKLDAAEARHAGAVDDYNLALDSVPTFTLHLRAVPPHEAERIKAEHPPTREQKQLVRRDNPGASIQWNPETYPGAIVAAATTRIEISDGETDPVTEVTAEEMTEIIHPWSDGDQLAIVTLVRTISQAGSNIAVDDLVDDLGKD